MSGLSVTGYLHPVYADSLSHLGIPRILPKSGGTIFERKIPKSDRIDAMGSYPVFCCRDWTGLDSDLDEMRRSELVSLVLVTDPFATISERRLQSIFDRVIPFKQHFVANTSRPIEEFISRHRRRLARRALARLSVEVSERPATLVQDWLDLHSSLASRRRMTGIGQLTASAVEKLLSVPGVVVLRAALEGKTVGMHIEMVHGDFVYGHYAAYNDLGYETGAACALHVFEIQHFADKERWIDWGGVSGGVPDRSDGLTEFKKAFSNESRPTYLCCAILDPVEYAHLSKRASSQPSPYFPAYRAGEFA
jgi:hypothetical protein